MLPMEFYQDYFDIEGLNRDEGNKDDGDHEEEELR